MKILDIIFGNNYIATIVTFIEILLVGISYSWFKKYKHRDYLILTICGTILLIIKFLAYIFYNSLLPVISPQKYLIFSFTFFIIRGTITNTVIFFAYITMLKWFIKWSSKKERIFNWLISAKGVILIIVINLVMNSVIGYLFNALLLRK